MKMLIAVFVVFCHRPQRGRVSLVCGPVRLDEADDHEPSYLGDSVGRWDGDTLVVDVIGFNEKAWLAGTGTIHSGKLHVVERYTHDAPESIFRVPAK